GVGARRARGGQRRRAGSQSVAAGDRLGRRSNPGVAARGGGGMTTFAAVRDKVRAGVPLDYDDGVVLFHHPNLPELGALANEVRERLHGDRTYYNLNLHINATNVCVADCMFCSFARLQPGDPGAYTMTFEEAWGK